jgi:predicted hydrolase (HD superfamily)
MTDATIEWSDADEFILGGLAAGLTHAEAGELAGVSAKTVQRRLRDDAFAAEVGRRRAEQVERITGRLTELSVRAVATLERVGAGNSVVVV